MPNKQILKICIPLCLLVLPAAVPQAASPRSFPAPVHPPIEAWKQEMLDQVNRIRAEGCRCGRKSMPPAKPLSWNSRLEKAAQGHADDMALHHFFEHRGHRGTNPGDRLEKAGYDWSAYAENIAWGTESVRETVLGWKTSPGHCRNIMSDAYTEMGAARQGDYWVQDFGRRMN